MAERKLLGGDHDVGQGEQTLNPRIQPSAVVKHRSFACSCDGGRLHGRLQLVAVHHQKGGLGDRLFLRIPQNERRQIPFIKDAGACGAVLAQPKDRCKGAISLLHLDEGGIHPVFFKITHKKFAAAVRRQNADIGGLCPQLGRRDQPRGNRAAACVL